ncbi:MAG: hypothetical protein QXW97_03185 [Candidatus Pacearchaeota archaeon]
MEEVKNSSLKNVLIIFVIVLFLFTLYFFVAYTFFVREKNPPEGEDAFLYALKEVNPLNLVFGDSSEEIYQQMGSGNLGYGSECSFSGECLPCLECVDNDENVNTPQVCMATPIRQIDPGCGKNKFCDGNGNCVECLANSDCKEGLLCNLLTHKCVKSCSEPSCIGRECGIDGCGNICGTCPPEKTCNLNGKCVSSCIPDCSNKECGPDGCGDFCKPGCLPNQRCNLAGICVDYFVNLKDFSNSENNSIPKETSSQIEVSGKRIFEPSVYELQSNAGYSNDYEKNEIIILPNGHKIKILEIVFDEKKQENSYVFFMISSKPRNVTLYVGEIKRFELNDDEYYDVMVELKSVEDNKANIVIRDINQKIIQENNQEDKDLDEKILKDKDSREIEPNLKEKSQIKKNYIIIAIGIIVIVFLLIMLVFLIFLFLKIKKISKNKEISKSPELKEDIEEHEKKINDILRKGYIFLNKKDLKGAKESYNKIKTIYNPFYDNDKRIYDKIGEFYKRILKLEL